MGWIESNIALLLGCLIGCGIVGISIRMLIHKQDFGNVLCVAIFGACLVVVGALVGYRLSASITTAAIGTIPGFFLSKFFPLLTDNRNIR